jgi:hypothetical protein
MSKSLKRVARVLAEAGVGANRRDARQHPHGGGGGGGGGLRDRPDREIHHLPRRGPWHAVLFITAGGNRVDAEQGQRAGGEPLGKADAGLIRAQTGFVIGGVAPVGHLSPIRAWFDPRLLEFRRSGRRRARPGMSSPSRLRRFAPVGGGTRSLHGLSGRICRQIRPGKAGFSAASDDRQHRSRGPDARRLPAAPELQHRRRHRVELRQRAPSSDRRSLSARAIGAGCSRGRGIPAPRACRRRG